MSGSYGSENDPTRRIPAEPTSGQRDSRYDRAPGDDRDAWQRERGAADPVQPPGRPPRRRGRDIGMWVFGAVIGFVVAFLVVALGTDEAADGDAAAASRIEALEADLDDRDAQIEELEARLAEAEAAAGDRAEDVQAQRDALDERAVALDGRAEALAEREEALDQRESDLADREAAVDEPPADDDADNGGLPDIDSDDVDTVVDRVLEQLRDLFGGD